MSKKKTEQQGEVRKKKRKAKWILIAIVVVFIFAAIAGGGKDKKEGTSDPATPDSSAVETQSTEKAESESVSGGYALEHGELLESNENEIDGKSVLVVKAKISSSYNNGATVDQNYYNVEDLIQAQGCDKFDEIQYWAVADMSDGSEQKVVSFTVDTDLIQQISEKKVVANQLGDHVSDLWVLPSLAE